MLSQSRGKLGVVSLVFVPGDAGFPCKENTMKTFSTKAIVAVMATTIGLTAIVPAMAQEAAPAPSIEATQKAPGPQGGPGWPGGPKFHQRGQGDIFNFGRGAEGIEVALVRLSHRIDLTDEQQGLLDDLKTAALAAADDFSQATEGLRPQRPAAGEKTTRPSFPEMLDKRIAFETAQLDALKAVQPAATAFFDSLTEEQQTKLMPQRGEWGPRGPQHGRDGGDRHHGPRGGFGG
jgi:hypothetical protein